VVSVEEVGTVGGKEGRERMIRRKKKGKNKMEEKKCVKERGLSKLVAGQNGKRR
jgi:hypothetical protein